MKEESLKLLYVFIEKFKLLHSIFDLLSSAFINLLSYLCQMPAITRQTATVFILGVLLFALVYSKFALTIGMLGLIGVSISPEAASSFDTHLKKIWHNYP